MIKVIKDCEACGVASQTDFDNLSPTARLELEYLRLLALDLRFQEEVILHGAYGQPIGHC